MDALPAELRSQIVRDLDRTAAARLASTNRYFYRHAADHTNIARLNALSLAITNKTLTFKQLLEAIASSDAGIVGKPIPKRDMQQCLMIAEQQCNGGALSPQVLPSLLRIVEAAFGDVPGDTQRIGSRPLVGITIVQFDEVHEYEVLIIFECDWLPFKAMCFVHLTWTAGKSTVIKPPGTVTKYASLVLEHIASKTLKVNAYHFGILDDTQTDNEPSFLNSMRLAARDAAAALFLSKWAGEAVKASKLFSSDEKQVYLHGPFTDVAAV